MTRYPTCAALSPALSYGPLSRFAPLAFRFISFDDDDDDVERLPVSIDIAQMKTLRLWHLSLICVGCLLAHPPRRYLTLNYLETRLFFFHFCLMLRSCVSPYIYIYPQYTTTTTWCSSTAYVPLSVTRANVFSKLYGRFQVVSKDL